MSEPVPLVTFDEEFYAAILPDGTIVAPHLKNSIASPFFFWRGNLATQTRNATYKYYRRNFFDLRRWISFKGLETQLLCNA